MPSPFDTAKKALADKPAVKFVTNAVKGFHEAAGGHMVQGGAGLMSMKYQHDIDAHKKLAAEGDALKARGITKPQTVPHPGVRGGSQPPETMRQHAALHASDNHEKIMAELQAKKKHHDDLHEAAGSERSRLRDGAGSTGKVVGRVVHAINPADSLADVGEAKKGTAAIPGALGDAAASLIKLKAAHSAFKIAKPLVKSAWKTAKNYVAKKAVGESVEEAAKAGGVGK